MVGYIDDLLIHTEIWEAHVKTLSELFKRFQEANFTVRLVKCLLGSRTVDFLGHSLGRGAIGLQDENVEKVRNAPRPKTKREVRAFLGLVGYYKEFVPNFAAVSAPRSDLVRKGQPYIMNWGDSQERAYNSLKVAMTSKPVLQLPDVNKKFVLRRMRVRYSREQSPVERDVSKNKGSSEKFLSEDLDADSINQFMNVVDRNLLLVRNQEMASAAIEQFEQVKVTTDRRIAHLMKTNIDLYTQTTSQQ
ncbi:Pol polyprotein, partial [Plakobranchus ocellatus]